MKSGNLKETFSKTIYLDPKAITKVITKVRINSKVTINSDKQHGFQQSQIKVFKITRLQ